MRQISTLIAVALAASTANAAEVTVRKWHGPRFHGADVYFPAYTYAGPVAPPIFNNGGAYCWHWFRAGRGWATTWWC
ncbi:MAG: hypothetical protein JOY92_15125 [Verrucomicrobia bacterium]|nr:hypothetical protein [Verrucomicrobiota bacterium]